MYKTFMWGSLINTEKKHIEISIYSIYLFVFRDSFIDFAIFSAIHCQILHFFLWPTQEGYLFRENVCRNSRYIFSYGKLIKVAISFRNLWWNSRRFSTFVWGDSRFFPITIRKFHFLTPINLRKLLLFSWSFMKYSIFFHSRIRKLVIFSATPFGKFRNFFRDSFTESAIFSVILCRI